MLHNKKIILLILLLALILGTTVHLALANGIGVPVLGVRQSDLDGDGQPDVTVIDCSFATSLDRVSVFDGGHDMRWGTEWQQITDFENDTWVFDVGADGSAQLVIRFAQENGHTVAFLYDDQDGDGQVTYELLGTTIMLEESDHWTLKVESDSSWFLSDGFPNQNLRFFADGRTDRWDEIVDKNHDGIPEYYVIGLRTFSLGGDDEVGGSGVWVNAGNARPRLLDGYLFWPFLVGNTELQGQRKFDTIPSVRIDWARAKVSGAGVTGYPIEAGYGIASFHSWQAGQANYANFENPMAYYDLAKDRDDQPELHIRMEYFGPLDPHLDIGKVPIPINDIRYSWNQRNSYGLSWDYKVGLAGTNSITSMAWFDNFGVQTVPYEVLPVWVSDQIWAWGTLVAIEDKRGYHSSEGIYEWAAASMVQTDISQPESRIASSQYDLRNYLAGRTTLPPDRYYQDIRPGMRGEFGYLQDRPYLYISPIDTRLHLRKAIQGIWNLGDEAEIRYANLDGDAYLDVWRYFERGELRRQLIVVSDYLLFTDENSVAIKQVKVSPSLFECFPPRNYDEWVALSQQLEMHQRDFAPDDFEAMMAQFDGPRTRIEGATLRDFRLTENGSRFVLELFSDFRVHSDDLDLSPHLPEPGAYVVTYDGTRFSIRRLTPPSLQVSEVRTGADGDSIRELEWASIETEIRNDGLEDVHDLPVCAVLGGPEGQQEVLTATVGLVPGEGSQWVTWDWMPGTPGMWELSIETNCLPGEETRASPHVLATDKIYVEPKALPPPRWFLSLGGNVRLETAFLLVSIVIVAGAVGALWAVETGHRSREGDVT